MRRFIVSTLVFLGTSFTVYAQTFSKTPLITGLAYPVAFELSSDGRIFLTQKGGFTAPTVDAQISVYDANGNFLSEFYDLTDSVDCEFERGLLGITLDPNFTSNHFVYVFYTYDSDPVNGGDARIRIQRFTDVNNTGTQPTIICDIDVPDNMGGAHQGGNIHFRPSDSTHIYVSMGDQANNLGWAAQLDNPFGKILRISKYPGAPPPSDNPFYDDGNPATANCDWIWAYGLRNSFDFCFGPNDSLYATENGTQYYDEVNLITRGGFYGWSHCEGLFDADTISLPCHAAGTIYPIAQFAAPLPALTGILFYTDTVFSLQQNHLITGDYMHADLYDIELGNAPFYDVVSSMSFWIDESQQYGITCLKQGSQGCIYVMEGGYTTAGGLYMICPDANGIQEETSTNHLDVNGPNPFSAETSISWSLSSAQQVSLVLYDTRGRQVAVIANEFQSAGIHSVTISAAKYDLSTGIYVCQLVTENETSAVKLVVE